MKDKILSLAIVGLFLTPLSCLAGSLKAVPVRIDFDAGKKTSIVRIKNTGDEKVTIQVSIKTWDQDENGKEIYKDTKDIVLFPKIASIAKDEQQIIRIGYQVKEMPVVERTYRLIIEELPVRDPGNKALKFVLRMIIPVFISPSNKTVDWSIEKARLKDGLLHLIIKNGGNTHIAISKINVTGKNENNIDVFSKEESGWYILANNSRYYSIEIPQAECLKTHDLIIAVSAGGSVIKTKLSVDKSMCDHKHGSVGKSTESTANR